jgi:hypothetical protein
VSRHTYAPMETAPKDRPIIAVCGGVEMAILWQSEPINAFCYWDDDELDAVDLVKGPITGWRALF